MFSSFFDSLYTQIAKIPFDTLVWCIWGSYIGIAVIVLVFMVFNRRVQTAQKRPFLALTNAYTGVNLALFLLKYEFPKAVLITALFWVAGYIIYGALVFASNGKKRDVRETTVMETTVAQAPALTKNIRPEVPAAKNNVRLEHAISVTDKLLSKELGRGDRQELEKLKNTLAVLQIKGSLSPAESDILNDNFNTLLKLMAKYNI